MLFEVHITCLTKDEEACEAVAKELHWKTSKIAGDPVLGKDTYFYLTTHGTDYYTVHQRMNWATAKLKQRGAAVVREKIELIMFDTKEGVKL